MISNCNKITLSAEYGASALNLGTLNSRVATGPEPEFSETVGELVDVLVDFVFPSERRVTHLPRLMTTEETIFSICKELILISVQYLPYCRVTCSSSAGPKTVSSTIPSGWHPFASLVLMHSLQIVVIHQFPDNMDGFVTNACPKTVRRKVPSLETSPVLLNSGRRWVASRASAKSVVTCCTCVVTTLTENQDQHLVYLDASCALGLYQIHTTK